MFRVNCYLEKIPLQMAVDIVCFICDNNDNDFMIFLLQMFLALNTFGPENMIYVMIIY